MPNNITEADARAALATAEQGRQHVIDEIAMPRWYWWGLAIGWIALGVIIDIGNPWVTAVATLAFGAGHAYAFGRVSAGRQATSRVRVRYETAGWLAPVVVIGSLIALGALTVAGALLVHEAGSAHPVTLASIGVAVILLVGGPRLMAVIRRRAAREVLVP